MTMVATMINVLCCKKGIVDDKGAWPRVERERASKHEVGELKRKGI